MRFACPLNSAAFSDRGYPTAKPFEGVPQDRIASGSLLLAGKKLQSDDALKSDPLDLVLSEPLFGAVIEFGCPRAFVRRHFLGVFERAAVLEIGGDAGRA